VQVRHQLDRLEPVSRPPDDVDVVALVQQQRDQPGEEVVVVDD
jgi:hypothetical protein